MLPSGLLDNGFMVVPGPFGGAELAGLSASYDRVVATADPRDFRDGSTTVRVNGLAREAAFDAIYAHGPLLAAANEVIGDRFKLSAFHTRTLKPQMPAARLHQDFPPLADGWPMVGFILAVDDFRVENGATRFLPRSQSLPALDPVVEPEEVQSACAPAGAMIIFNGSVWHGHGANVTARPRRSIQGALIRWDQEAAVDHARDLSPEARARLGPTERALLGCTIPRDAPSFRSRSKAAKDPRRC